MLSPLSGPREPPLKMVSIKAPPAIPHHIDMIRVLMVQILCPHPACAAKRGDAPLFFFQCKSTQLFSASGVKVLAEVSFVHLIPLPPSSDYMDCVSRAPHERSSISLMTRVLLLPLPQYKCFLSCLEFFKKIVHFLHILMTAVFFFF